MKDWHIIVLLGITIILYARIFMKDDYSRSQALTREMEETFEQFANDLEEENKQIMDYILKLKNGYEMETAKLNGRLERLENQLDALTASLNGVTATPNAEETDLNAENAPSQTDAVDPQAVAKEASMAATDPGAEDPSNPTEPDSPAPLTIQERYKSLFQWYREGKSIDWISKQTGMQKGEIQLIMKLARQEEASRG